MNLKEILTADTAAAVDSVDDPEGMINLKESNGKGIVMGNGATEKAASTGNIPGTFCNKHGEEEITGTIGRVRYLPTGACNLFSVTKRMLAGWAVHADSKGIRLTKGGGHCQL